MTRINFRLILLYFLIFSFVFLFLPLYAKALPQCDCGSDVDCGDGYYCSATSCTGNGDNNSLCKSLQPSCSISANPLTIYVGQSSTLTWSSTNATSCTASCPLGNCGTWSGNKALSGSGVVAPLAAISPTKYSLTCTNSYNGLSATCSVSLTVRTYPTPDWYCYGTPNPAQIGAVVTWNVKNTDGTIPGMCAPDFTWGVAWSGDVSGSKGCNPMTNPPNYAITTTYSTGGTKTATAELGYTNYWGKSIKVGTKTCSINVPCASSKWCVGLVLWTRSSDCSESSVICPYCCGGSPAACYGVCAAGRILDYACGNCGEKHNTCLSNCTWGGWGACHGEGVCAPGATGSQSCGNCGIQSRTCSSTCAWLGWETCTEPPGACTPGTTRSCGDCGRQTCTSSCSWPISCTGEGVCAVGATSSQSCGNCGIQSRTCSAACAWGSYGSCTGEGVCAPNSIQIIDCGNCGTKGRACSAACAWGAYGSCTGEGVCAPGTTQSQTQACGNCNTGTQSRTITCNASCGWPAWPVWGACTGGGICAPGSTSSQACGCSGTQTNICSSTCSWEGWGACSSTAICTANSKWCVGDTLRTCSADGCSYSDQACGAAYWTNNYRCSGTMQQREYISQGCSGTSCYGPTSIWYDWAQCPYCCSAGVCTGVCTSGAISPPQACGNCGTQTRTCSASCAWGAYGSCQETCPPTVDIKANASNGPITIPYNTSATLSWTSTNATSCTASNAWSGVKAINGTETTANLISNNTYTITCTGPGGSISDSVTVNAGAATLSVALTANKVTGPAPLTGVILTADVSGSAIGTINYTFYCNRADVGTNVTLPASHKLDGTNTDPYSAPATTCDSVYTTPGTYTAKVIAERGTAPSAQAQLTITVNVPPNQPPTATNPTVTPSDPCNRPAQYYSFRWTYTDPDGDTQKRFDLQVDNNSDFSSPIVNRTQDNLSGPAWASPNENSQIVSLATSPVIPDSLLYNTLYYWRARVYDAHSLASGWANGSSFTTSIHHYPAIYFNWAPTRPNVNETVQFNDTSICWDVDAVNGSDCASTKADSYLWTFPSGAPASSVLENPTTKFSTPGNYNVGLRVTDTDGHACTDAQSVIVDYPMPKWKEIRPW